jgi:hypothetical protein
MRLDQRHVVARCARCLDVFARPPDGDRRVVRAMHQKQRLADRQQLHRVGVRIAFGHLAWLATHQDVRRRSDPDEVRDRRLRDHAAGL